MACFAPPIAHVHVVVGGTETPQRLEYRGYDSAGIAIDSVRTSVLVEGGPASPEVSLNPCHCRLAGAGPVGSRWLHFR